MLTEISIKYVMLSIKLLSYLIKNLYEVESEILRNFGRVINGVTRQVTFEIQ
jgi:hypothetical protein